MPTLAMPITDNIEIVGHLLAISLHPIKQVLNVHMRILIQLGDTQGTFPTLSYGGAVNSLQVVILSKLFITRSNNRLPRFFLWIAFQF